MKVKDLMTLPEYRAIDYLSVFRINPKTYKINYCSKGQPDCVCVGDYKRESFDFDNPVMPKETFKSKVGMSKEEVENRASEIAASYGVDKAELLKAYGSMDVIEYDMKMHKALEILKENN